MKKNTVRQLTVGALLAALTFIATAFLSVPVPAAGGYVHPGDIFVCLSGMVLPFPVCCFAGAMGSALADLQTGFALYLPATLVIKGLMAALTHWGSRGKALKSSDGKGTADGRSQGDGKSQAQQGESQGQGHEQRRWISKRAILALFLAIFVSIGGYFAYDCLIFGLGAALAAVGYNALQGVATLVFYLLIGLAHGTRGLREQVLREQIPQKQRRKR